jgi:hypothetical protein
MEQHMVRGHLESQGAEIEAGTYFKIGWHCLSSLQRRRKGKLFSQVLRTLVQSHTLLQLLAIERVDAQFTN